MHAKFIWSFVVLSGVFAGLPASQPRVVMLGDSLTQFANWNRITGRHDVARFGFGGETTERLLSRVGDVATSPSVFLMIGVNDLRNATPLKTIESNYRAILDRLTGDVTVQSVLFTRDTQLNAQIAQLNALLVEAARERGHSYLDLNPLIAPEGVLRDDFTTDGLHLSDRAYHVWAGEIVRALAAPERGKRSPKTPPRQ